ncbi:MAG: hypothetical protein K0S41_3674 [Anaerocolumna sp.]|jgi:hypothetical protein|nr:hypothetical protein [Anaerocolumna sp.]
MSDWFYDKDINIINKTEGYKDAYSIWHDGSYSVIKTLECDVQPITKEIAIRDFGIDKVVKYRIFCDYSDLIEVGTIIQYLNHYYRVESIISWDYLDMIVGDYNVV